MDPRCYLPALIERKGEQDPGTKTARSGFGGIRGLTGIRMSRNPGTRRIGLAGSRGGSPAASHHSDKCDRRGTKKGIRVIHSKIRQRVLFE